MSEQEKFARVEIETDARGTFYRLEVARIPVAWANVRDNLDKEADQINTAHAQSLARFRERAARVAEETPCHYQTGNMKYPVNLAHEIAAAIREIPL